MVPLAQKVAESGGFDVIYHDNQWRTFLTALVYHGEMPRALLVNVGLDGQSQALGSLEGEMVTPQTIAAVQYFTEHPDERPPGLAPCSTRLPDTFGEWARRWFAIVEELGRQALLGKRVAIVTHNRNIHALASLDVDGDVDSDLMNQAGPGPNTIHTMTDQGLKEWDGSWIKPGVYLVRHAETAWN